MEASTAVAWREAAVTIIAAVELYFERFGWSQRCWFAVVIVAIVAVQEAAIAVAAAGTTADVINKINASSIG